MAARFGYTSDLTPAERRKMKAFNRKLAVGRGTRRAKSFLKENGALIAVGTLAVLMLVFRKELKETIGSEPPRLLTP